MSKIKILIKEVIISGAIGVCAASLANYFIVGLPHTEISNAINHGISGGLGGFIGSFAVAFKYIYKAGKSERSKRE